MILITNIKIFFSCCCHQSIIQCLTFIFKKCGLKRNQKQHYNDIITWVKQLFKDDDDLVPTDIVSALILLAEETERNAAMKNKEKNISDKSINIDDMHVKGWFRTKFFL